MKITYSPHRAYKWFGIVMAIGAFFYLFLMVVSKQYLPGFFSMFILTLVFGCYLIRQSFKEIIITEESLTIRGETKEDTVFPWEEIPHAYIRSGYKSKWIILSQAEQTDDEINRQFRLFSGDRFIRGKCIVFPVAYAMKGCIETLGFVTDKYVLDVNHIKTIQGLRYMWF